MKIIELSIIVKRAYTETVTDIGQLSKQERNSLKRAVKHGTLISGKGGPFPILKTVYAKPGFDFAADREKAIEQMRFAMLVDKMRLGRTIYSETRFQEL